MTITLPTRSRNAKSMHLWRVAPALISPKGILLEANVTRTDVNACYAFPDS